jgi:polyribonucleotide nucleotidyltransferase
MRIADLEEANRTAEQVEKHIRQRDAWAKYENNSSRSLSNIFANTSGLPNIVDDGEMNIAIRDAITAEYDKRIEALVKQLNDYGVDTAHLMEWARS